MKEERLLKKVDKLLKLYGVEDEEREKFILDLKDKKYDDQEEVEETVEGEEESTEEIGGEKPEMEEVEEVEEVSEDAEKPAETEPVEGEKELEEEPVEGEPLPEEQSAEMEEHLEEEHQEDDDKHEDLLKTIDGLKARVESLEDIISKLGTPVEEDIGVSPSNPSGESVKESEFDRFNRLRRGR